MTNQDRTLDVLDDAARAAIAFRRGIADRPMRPQQDYRAMLAALERATPEHGEAGQAVVAELVASTAAGLNAMAGPRFFGWVIGGCHPVGLAADWLTAAWHQNAGNHIASPSAAAFEAVAAEWLLDLLDLPREASVGFVTGATVANMVCLAAARGEVLARAGWDVEAHGLFGAPPIRVLLGDDAHTTVFTALQMLGLGHDRVTRVATDADGAIEVAAFAASLGDDPGPVIAITQAGQLNTGAFDPTGAIADLLRGRNAWVHVDGAFGLWARASPATQALAAGVERADSWATDGHKWLQVPYDCGYAIVRHEQAHRRAMTAAASYLPAAAEDERDPSLYVPELSRRARGFATWAMIRHLGRDGIAAMVTGHVALARHMAERLAAEPGIAVLNRVVLNQAIVRFGADLGPEPGDELTRAVIQRIQQDGVCFVGGARWRGRWVMRLSVIGWSTTRAEADRSVDAMLAAYRAVRAA